MLIFLASLAYIRWVLIYNAQMRSDQNWKAQICSWECTRKDAEASWNPHQPFLAACTHVLTKCAIGGAKHRNVTLKHCSTVEYPKCDIVSDARWSATGCAEEADCVRGAGLRSELNRTAAQLRAQLWAENWINPDPDSGLLLCAQLWAQFWAVSCVCVWKITVASIQIPTICWHPHIRFVTHRAPPSLSPVFFCL